MTGVNGDVLAAWTVWRSLAVAAALLFWATAGATGERPEGLLWNRSGLAATLPLQVQTNKGADYLLQLRSADTREPVLAAYIRGGEFFRVLVPPGHYDVLFASGEDWQGETALFGPETRRVVLTPPLMFSAKVSRREGHLIDLRNMDDIAVTNFAICQRQMLDPESLRRPAYPEARPIRRSDLFGLGLSAYPIPRFETYSRVCD